MRTDVNDLFAQAAYEARRQALLTGAYPKQAFTIPNSERCFTWDEIDPALEDAVKWLYRKEAQATIEAFISFVMQHGTTEAKQAIATAFSEMQDVLYTQRERATMEAERWRQEPR
ncbi:hypothetical protein KSF_086900 [Reticulibacter mediterranei]|uniref:Uncharacterized protein n=1 Tax=Reticulibacter mediterranei TaxID=2778369 RepID=A0A8J3N8V8_9CHLR|nr:hypothetical protein [Reticulibacter mediterranei]GHO98642.1 hypothetical protein KSF_086900 [Reticulibacter mediterranei]